MVLAESLAESFDDASGLAGLISRIDGTVHLPGDELYGERRRTWNLCFDRHPSLIVRPANATDVAEAITYAGANSLEIAIRSGGHSTVAHSSTDGGCVIDLASLRGITIDPKARTARVEAGVTAAEITDAAHEHGLALPLGDTSSVGLGGITLGGGIGWLVRKYGLTIDSLRAVELVTANGEVIRASETEHPDLFWALRGGGGNFGVVTAFEFDLHPAGMVYGGALVLPATVEVVREYLELAEAAPEELTNILFVAHAPPLPFIPEEHWGKLVLLAGMVYAGDHGEAERAVAPFRTIAEPIADIVGPMPYPAIYELTAEATRPWKSGVRMMYADHLDDSVIATLLASTDIAPSPMTMTQLRVLGGAMARVDGEATAFAHRNQKLMISLLAHWDGDDDETNQAWLMETWNAVRGAGAGVYVNFLGNEGEERIREAYNPAVYRRLAAVKAAYDPENVFRLNQNIRPAR